MTWLSKECLNRVFAIVFFSSPNESHKLRFYSSKLLRWDDPAYLDRLTLRSSRGDEGEAESRSCRLWQTSGKTAGGEGRRPEPSCHEAPGQNSVEEKKKDQLSFPVRHRHSAEVAFLLNLSHMFCLNADFWQQGDVRMNQQASSAAQPGLARLGLAVFMYSFREVCQITMDGSQSSSWGGVSEASACVYWASRAFPHAT